MCQGWVYVDYVLGGSLPFSLSWKSLFYFAQINVSLVRLFSFMMWMRDIYYTFIVGYVVYAVKCIYIITNLIKELFFVTESGKRGIINPSNGLYCQRSITSRCRPVLWGRVGVYLLPNRETSYGTTSPNTAAPSGSAVRRSGLLWSHSSWLQTTSQTSGLSSY